MLTSTISNLFTRFELFYFSLFLTTYALVLFFVSHYLWFSYFTSMFFVFWDILAFFLICVWLVPFIFFISLTSDDNNLPNVYGSVAASMFSIFNDEMKLKVELQLIIQLVKRLKMAQRNTVIELFYFSKNYYKIKINGQV